MRRYTRRVLDLFADPESLQLDDLEQRCRTAGADVAAAMREAGYTFDASTYVISEIVRVAGDRGLDADQVVEWFESSGFIDQAVAALD